MLVEGTIREQCVPDDRTSTLAGHQFGPIERARELGDAASELPEGSAESDDLALAHHVGHHGSSVVVELDVSDLACDLGTETASADLHGTDEHVAHPLQLIIGAAAPLRLIDTDDVAVKRSERDERHDVDALRRALDAREELLEGDPV